MILCFLIKVVGVKERKFRKEYSKQLLNIADGDLDSAEGLFEIGKGRPENVIFHAQQSIEKSIKAVLCATESPVPLSHDVILLLAKLDSSQVPPHADALADLTPFATVKRYEEGNYELTKEEIQSSLQIARDILGWAAKIVREQV